MFEKTCDYYRSMAGCRKERTVKNCGADLPEGKGIAEKASFDEVYSLYLYRLPRYETRIAGEWASGKEREKERRCRQAESKAERQEQKVCPNCGRKMKQQFIGLQHCKCGMSWKKTSDILSVPGIWFSLWNGGKQGKRQSSVR